MKNIVFTIAVIFFTVPVLFITVQLCVFVWRCIIGVVLETIRNIRISARNQRHLNTAYSGEKLYWDAKTNTLYGPVHNGD